MIYLDIVGRCGNQMFQYAFAKKISVINNNDKITVDFAYVTRAAKDRNDPTFRDELQNFEAGNDFIKIDDGTNKIYKYGSKSQLFVFKIYRKVKFILQRLCKDKRMPEKLMHRVLCHYGIYWYFAPHNLKHCSQKNKFIFGYFEDPAYFEDIKDVLIKEFKPIYPECEKNAEMYKAIRENNSVCISFRKWASNEPVNEDWFVCDENYYNRSIEKIKQLQSDIRFVIFSNDVEWVKEHFDLPSNSVFEDGTDTVYEKVRLMSSCKHFIISNSTFSWWAQFLGNYENKIVISPVHWWKNEKITYPLIQEHFYKI